MSTVEKEAVIVFDKDNDQVFEWSKLAGIDLDQVALPDLKVSLKFYLDDFDEDVLRDFVAEFDKRAPDWNGMIGVEAEDIDRIYRYMAEGDLREAMAEMKHVFDFLRTPEAECGLMASIAAGNAKHG